MMNGSLDQHENNTHINGSVQTRSTGGRGKLELRRHAHRGLEHLQRELEALTPDLNTGIPAILPAELTTRSSEKTSGSSSQA